MKNILHRPHIKTFIYIIILLLISGVLSLVFYDIFPAWSALLGSISAGCVTGIIFYILVNIRSNEIRDANEEYAEAEKYHQISRKTIALCIECIERKDFFQINIPQIIDNLRILVLYISTLCFDCPRTAKLIVAFPENFKDTLKEIDNLVLELENVVSSGEISAEHKFFEHTCVQAISFCAQIENILFTPMLKLMTESYKLDESII